jgi:hypothetical protein
VLAQGATDAQGQAQFAGLINNQVRVVVAGVLPNGARLVQPGQDAHGIAVLLGPPPAHLELRVTADGMVIPDPASMLEPVPSGTPSATVAADVEYDGRIVFPTSSTFAPSSPRPPVPDASATGAAVPTPVDLPDGLAGAAEAAPSIPASLIGLGWALATFVVTVGVLVVRSALRRRRS